MSNGFLGDRVGVSRLLIEGSVAQVDVQFVSSKTGQVHGLMKHSIDLSDPANGEVRETAAVFLTAITDYITKHHFEDPDVSGGVDPTEKTVNGIAEALSGKADEPG